MRKRILLSLAMLWAAFLILQAQTSGSKDAIGLRVIFPNHLWPVTDQWDGEDFGSGLEFEYSGYLNKALNLAVPLKIYKTRLPTDDLGNFQENAVTSLDLLLQLKLTDGSRMLYPYIFAGLGGNLEGLENANLSLPVGLGLNFQLAPQVYLSLKGEYRLGLDEDLRDNLQIGMGVLLFLGEGAPEPAKITDQDGDGIPDERDLCPAVAGLQQFNGCPDSDGDGVPDGEDECPQLAGQVVLKGCPDRDNDGIIDTKDACPDQAGPLSRNGCPFLDADGDDVEDSKDACPDVPGLVALNGCPDRDGDGIADAEDRCPDKAGSITFAGCPDTDGDGLADPDDRCPTTAGPASNRGCPEIKTEDKEVLTFAMKAVQFETARASLRPQSYAILDQVVDILKRYPDYKLHINGHTDSIGEEAANQKLSEARAKSCYDYIISQGISASRLDYAGFGESRPIANNKYASGREQNRRVAFDIYLD
ncbi:MAG: OmpA family protein [Lewinellaceae bacterium]|nr:OmpA family protein [Lewinellaceae bacterium]